MRPQGLRYDRVMRWFGQWVPGTIYPPYAVVYDNGWAMVSNEHTSDRPSPQPQGPPSFDLPDTPLFATQSAVGRIRSGHTYSFTEDGWVTRVEVWAPQDSGLSLNYRVIILDITDPDNPLVSTVDDPVLVGGEWTLVNIDRPTVRAGGVALFVLDAYDNADAASWTHTWLYGGTSNAAPKETEWNRTANQGTVRIANIGLQGDQTAQLANVTVGTLLHVEGVSNASLFYDYQVESITALAGYYEFGVILTNSGGNINSQDETSITAVIPVPASTPYVEIAGGAPSPSWATVEGYLDVDGVVQPGATANAYGVRVAVQPASASDSWDVLSTSAVVA